VGPEQGERGDARIVDRSAATSDSHKSARWLGLAALAAGVTLGLAQPLVVAFFGGVGVFAGPSFVGLFFMLCLASMILVGLAAAAAPAGRWATVPIVVMSLWLALGMVAGNLIAGGFRVGYAAPRPSSSPQVPTGPAWSASGDMVTARRDHSATLLQDGKVLVAGGIDRADRRLSSAELFDPVTRTWSQTGRMVVASQGHTATLLHDGRVLVISSDGQDVQLYDPASGTWKATAEMNSPRRGFSVTLLNDGRVLVAGGLDPATTERPLASAELYRPTGRWTTAGSMGWGRFDDTATVLSGGQVLIAGGQSGSPQSDDLSPLTSTELYDPSGDRWRPTGAMAAGRANAAATALPDGRVLVVGGSWSDPTIQLYDPVSKAWKSAGKLDGLFSPEAVLLRDGRVLVLDGFSGDLQFIDPDGLTRRHAPVRTYHGGGATVTQLSDGRLLMAGGAEVFEREWSRSTQLYDPSVAGS
jgi:hypothetical protein